MVRFSTFLERFTFFTFYMLFAMKFVICSSVKTFRCSSSFVGWGFFQKFFSKNTFGLKSLQPSLFQIFFGFAHFSHWLFLLWPFYWFTKKSSSKIVTRIWIEYLICSVKLPAIWVVPRIWVIICTDLKMSLHLPFLNCILVRIIQSKF